MARRGHLALAGGVYHVTNRGVDRRDIVMNDDDRREWFRRFHRVALRYGWRVFAHVLMTNHFHLFLKTPDANLSLGMHDFEGSYAQYFNQHHNRTGALFQGRYHPVLVESQGHLWAVSRYTHLNPCRAQLVSRPDEYRWSTYRFFVDPRDAPKWLDWRTVLCEFGGGEEMSRHSYCRFVESGLIESPTNPVEMAYEGLILGSEQFINEHRHLVEETKPQVQQHRKSITIERVLEVVTQTFDVDAEVIQQSRRHRNWARDAAIWLCHSDGRIALKSIADAFGGVSVSTVTDTVRRCEERQRRVPDYQAQCESIRDQV